MNKDRPDKGRLDCIGEGRYYQTRSQESLDSSGEEQPAAIDTARSDGRKDLRIKADTGEAYSLSAIIAGLRDPDWCTRVSAAWDLGSKGDVEGILPLIDALHDDHKQVREMAHDALVALEAGDEPLPVRVLLCDTVADGERTDILLGMARARTRRGLLFGFGAVKEYCENVLEEHGTAALNMAEQEVLDTLKRSATAVLADLARRADSRVLLRPGERDGGMHAAQLLRSAEHENQPDNAERLLRAAEKDAS